MNPQRNNLEPGYDRKREAAKAAVEDAVQWMLHMGFTAADARRVVEETLLGDEEHRDTPTAYQYHKGNVFPVPWMDDSRRPRGLLAGLMCRRLGHNFVDRYVGDGQGYTYCRRCRLGED